MPRRRVERAIGRIRQGNDGPPGNDAPARRDGASVARGGRGAQDWRPAREILLGCSRASATRSWEFPTRQPTWPVR
eukprot:4594816-Pyramimonas_sp.AAC.1